MSKKKSFGFFGKPVWLEFGEFGKKEFKMRGDSRDEVLKGFFEYIKEKDRLSQKRVWTWLYGKNEQER